MEKQKKILIIEDVDLSINIGPKIHFLNLAKEFTKLGFNVCAILPKPQGKLEFEVNQFPFKIIFTPFSIKKNHIFRNLLRCLSQFPSVTKELFKKPRFVYIRLSSYSIIICLWINLVKFFARKTKVKIIGELNGWIPDEQRTTKTNFWKIFFVEKFLRWNIQLVNILRVVTPGLKNIVLSQTKINSKKVFVVGSGTDTDFFRPINKVEARKKIGLDLNSFIVGFVGNLVKWQGVEYLIKAIPTILKDIPNVQFVIVGDGPELKNLKQQAEQLKISEKIIFTGEVLYKEVPYYINSFDIATATFIVARNKKCGLSPLKIYDYAACGIPIVAPRIPGLETIEKYNIGVLVTPEKPREMANAVIDLLRNPQKREAIRRKARQVAEQNFSWERTAQEIVKYVRI